MRRESNSNRLQRFEVFDEQMRWCFVSLVDERVSHPWNDLVVSD